MSKTPQPGRNDRWICDFTEYGTNSIDGFCICWQGEDSNGGWRVRVDRNGVAYTQWETWGAPF